jgi:predicted SAM-dependent methyltransferase
MEILSLHAENLLPSGILVIAVPNHRSYDAAFYKNKWAAYDVPRHLWHFTENDMIKLAQKNQLALEHVRPLIFDSFYVSMLSEKNKNGQVVKGVFVGLLSNIKARFTKQPFSSQIYVFRKLPF